MKSKDHTPTHPNDENTQQSQFDALNPPKLHSLPPPLITDLVVLPPYTLCKTALFTQITLLPNPPPLRKNDAAGIVSTPLQWSPRLPDLHMQLFRSIQWTNLPLQPIPP